MPLIPGPLARLLATMAGLGGGLLRRLEALGARAESPGRRRVWASPGRAHLELRGVHRPDGEVVARAVEKALEAMPHVRWAEVNPVLARVVVVFDDGAVDVDDLTGVVEGVEEAHGLTEEDFPSERPVHPGDLEPIRHAAVAVGADAAGIGLGALGRLLRLPPFPPEVGGVTSLLESIPGVRRTLDRRPPAETAVVAANAVLQGLTQGPLGLVVDAAHRSTVLAELLARRQAWILAEPRLNPGPRPEKLAAVDHRHRPVPLPPGLVDTYAQRVSVASLGLSGAAFAATRDLRRTADVLMAGVPRAARLGREGFAAQADRDLAARGVIAMDARALRRLDRIDTVVLDADAVLSGPELDPAATALTAAIRKAGHSVVVAGPRAGASDQLNPDGVVPGGRRLAASVHGLQAEGKVVALVSRRPSAALRAADCGIGVLPADDAHPPWGAHLLCPSLGDAAVIIEATALARRASRHSVLIAMTGSGVASLFALSPLPGAGGRAIAAVNLATLTALGAGTWTGRLPRAGPARTPDAAPWHALDAGEVMDRLTTSPLGLPPDEADRRRVRVPQKKGPSLPSIMAVELATPLTGILAAGAVLSAAVGSVVDAAMVGGVIGIDALLGALQRLRTERVIGQLASALSDGQVRVLRAGGEASASVDDLVPGDIVLLQAGDAVPADSRVLDSVGLEADESSLTGESLPVAKEPEAVARNLPVADRRSMLYAGTAVAAGRGSAVVVATGDATEARRGLADGAEPPPSGVQTRLRRLTDVTVPVVLGAGAGLALNGLARGRSPREAVATGASLAAAAVPEGLPFVATVAQAGAARRLAGRGVLVRNPQVLEALGRVDVLCFDKTGTLTEGQLQLRRVSDGGADQAAAGLTGARRRVLSAALRATPRDRGAILPHPTDQAIVDGAAAAGIGLQHDAPGWQKVDSLPFEPGRGYHAVLGRRASGPLLSVKGAPEVVLPRCESWVRRTGTPVPLDAGTRARLDAEVDRLARQGLRVLAVAERDASGRQDLDDDRVVRLQLLGFVGVADAARSSAMAPVAEMVAAGINVVMVTGDHPSTAGAVAAELGMLNGRRVLAGPELDELDDPALDAVIEDVAVFARVAPADKVRIVKALQRAGKVVAMTGDGANDAQAIRLADVGVAFGPRATSAARDAADLIIVDDRVETLIDAIAEGRVMWASVRDALALLLGGNLGEVIFTTGAALVTGDSPLNARQLLAVNLFTDLVPAMAIAVQPPPAGRVDLRREGPENSLAGALAREVAVRAAFTAAGAGGAWLAARATGTPTRARTVALAALVGAQLGQTLLIGRRSPLVMASAIVSTGGLVAVIQVPALSQFFGCRPLGPVGWGIAATAAGVATVGAAAATTVLARSDGNGLAAAAAVH
jgi:cation-transporting ATPase I